MLAAKNDASTIDLIVAGCDSVSPNVTTDQRKAEILQRLKEAKHPRRASAVFSVENDHNPFILQDCPKCHGIGKVCRHFTTRGGRCVAREQCDSCGGKGITGEIERYFSNDNPEIVAECRSEGRVACPACGWRFRATDPHAWTGQRHMRCGQKLKLTYVE